MKGEIYYREKWPKEFRIQIENEDELKLLHLLFNYNPKILLGKFKVIELEEAGYSKAWRDNFIKQTKGRTDSEYDYFGPWDAIDEELNKMKSLGDASNI